MKKTTVVFLLLFSVFVLGTPGFAATVWLDAVISFDQPTGSSTTNNDPTTALGPDDDNFVSIDIPETLILAFTDNSALDGTGNDLRVPVASLKSTRRFSHWVRCPLLSGPLSALMTRLSTPGKRF